MKKPSPINILSRIDPSENQGLIEKVAGSADKIKGSFKNIDSIIKAIEIGEAVFPVIMMIRTWKIMSIMDKATALCFYILIRVFLLIITLPSWFISSKLSFKYASTKKREAFCRANLIESSIYLVSIVSLIIYKQYCIYIMDWTTPISWLEEGTFNVKTSCVILSAIPVFFILFPMLNKLFKSETFKYKILKL